MKLNFGNYCYEREQQKKFRLYSHESLGILEKYK